MTGTLRHFGFGMTALAGASLILSACEPLPKRGFAEEPKPVSPACQSYAGPPPPEGNSGLVAPALGALGGAGLGALAGNLMAGKHHNTNAILGGTALGGVLGGLGGYGYNRYEQSQEAEYRQQQLIQCNELANQHEQSDLLNKWNGGTAPAATGAIDQPADIMTAQRLLLALNYYKGPIDGVLGPETSGAVKRFQGDHGLPETGDVTPALLNRMKIAL